MSDPLATGTLQRLERAIILVADGLGCGELPDAASYGDVGAHTLAHVAAQGLENDSNWAVPNLQALGLAHVTELPLAGIARVAKPAGAFGRLAERSAGKDTTTGHWEMMGVITEVPLATFPNGFPKELLDELKKATGYDVIGNKIASGTTILDELGEEHLATKKLILYTSADSVFQIAAHASVLPVPELYRVCEAARQICDRYQIGRVIARPFVGTPGAWKRTYDRRDFSMVPPTATVLDTLQANGIPTVGIGKIGDIFSGRGLDEDIHTEGNRDGLEKTLEVLGRQPRGLIFVNLVDFDMLYGHRNDAVGFSRCLVELDEYLPKIRECLGERDLCMITADHGNDPTTPSTDHTREYAPLLAFGPPAYANRSLGVRASFADIGKTLLEAFGIANQHTGESFWRALGR